MPPYHLVTLRNTCIIFQQNWLWLWVTFLLHSFPILSSASIMLRSHSIHSLLFFACTALLLLLSRFSRVRLCVTPQTAAHQAPLSLGFSRQEHWSGLPFLSPRHESEKVKVKLLSRVRLLATPWTAAYQAPPPMGFSRQEYWSGVPLPSPSTYLFFEWHTMQNIIKVVAHPLRQIQVHIRFHWSCYREQHHGDPAK